MEMILCVILFTLLIIDCIVLSRISSKLDRLDDFLVDFEMLYYKMQQFLRKEDDYV